MLCYLLLWVLGVCGVSCLLSLSILSPIVFDIFDNSREPIGYLQLDDKIDSAMQILYKTKVKNNQ